MNPIDQLEPQEQDVNPWISIWLKPKQAIAWLVDHNPGMFTTLYLIFIGGLQFGLSQAESKSLGDVMSSPEIFRRAVFMSGFGGLITYHIIIGGIFFCSTFFDGKGGFRQTQMAFAWSFIPNVASLIIKLLMYLIIGDDLFTSKALEGPIEFVFLGYTGLMWILAIWHIILLVLNVSYIQQLPIGKTILVMVITTLLIVAPILIFFLL